MIKTSYRERHFPQFTSSVQGLVQGRRIEIQYEVVNFNGEMGNFVIKAIADDPNYNITVSNGVLNVACGTPLMISCQADIEVDNDAGMCGAVIDIRLGVAGGCGEFQLELTGGFTSDNMVFPPGSGLEIYNITDLFPVGSTQMVFEVTDEVGSTAICSFTSQ